MSEEEQENWSTGIFGVLDALINGSFKLFSSAKQKFLQAVV